MSYKKSLRYLILSSLFLFLVSCASNGDVERGKNPIEEEIAAKYGADRDDNGGIGKLFSSLSGSGDFEGYTANDILWETALDKLSFMPLASVDKASGSIITDWHMINSTNRIKINFIIVNDLIDETSVSIRVFQESYNDGMWTQTERNTALENKIKNNILSSAIKLSTASQL